MSWFRRWKPDFTDGIIDLVPFRLRPSPVELGFGQVYNYLITPHGKSREMGQIELRLGESRSIYYFGHIGYHIDPPYRGHRYALRACRLLLPLIRQSGKSSIVITTDTDNIGSRKTCAYLGCHLERTVPVPLDITRRFEISSRKVRYIWCPEETPPSVPE